MREFIIGQSWWGSQCKAIAVMSGGESEVATGKQSQQSGSKAEPEVEEHDDKLEPS